MLASQLGYALCVRDDRITEFIRGNQVKSQEEEHRRIALTVLKNTSELMRQRKTPSDNAENREQCLAGRRSVLKWGVTKYHNFH